MATSRRSSNDEVNQNSRAGRRSSRVDKKSEKLRHPVSPGISPRQSVSGLPRRGKKIIAGDMPVDVPLATDSPIYHKGPRKSPTTSPKPFVSPRKGRKSTVSGLPKDLPLNDDTDSLVQNKSLNGSGHHRGQPGEFPKRPRTSSVSSRKGRTSAATSMPEKLPFDDDRDSEIPKGSTNKSSQLRGLAPASPRRSPRRSSLARKGRKSVAAGMPDNLPFDDQKEPSNMRNATDQSGQAPLSPRTSLHRKSPVPRKGRKSVTTELRSTSHTNGMKETSERNASLNRSHRQDNDEESSVGPIKNVVHIRRSSVNPPKSPRGRKKLAFVPPDIEGSRHSSMSPRVGRRSININSRKSTRESRRGDTAAPPPQSDSGTTKPARRVSRSMSPGTLKDRKSLRKSIVNRIKHEFSPMHEREAIH